MKPAVMQICLSPSWGGMEMYTVNLTQLFEKKGHYSCCVCKKGSPMHDKLIELGLNHVAVEGSDYFSPKTSLTIKKTIKKNNIKAIYCIRLKNLWLIWPALWGNKNTKLIGVAQMFLKNINKKDFLHRLIYSRLNKLVALTNIQKQELLKCLPVLESNYKIIPNGISVEDYQPRDKNTQIRKDLGAGDEDILIGLIGRIDPQKGQIELVKAAAEVVKKFPQAKFVLIGEETHGETSIKPQIEEIIQKNNLKNNVLLAGFRKDVRDVLNSLDVFVMPSYEEAFGIVLAEAMASGLPCISTLAGSPPEIIENGKSGLLVEPKSASALAEGLIKILEDRELRTRLAQNARQRAVEHFDINLVFNQLSGLINEH